jgi:hypothetical protein
MLLDYHPPIHIDETIASNFLSACIGVESTNYQQMLSTINPVTVCCRILLLRIARGINLQ